MSPGGFPRLPLVQSDQRLVALARGGDQHAFETLVRRHRRPLLRYCRRMGLSDARAEDVLQQALLQAWLALERGSDVRAPKAWLYRTVHNTAVNVLRSPRDDHGALDDRAHVDTSPSAESAVERRIAVRETLSDVAALPQMQRDAILLTAIDGSSHAEIASALGVTHGAVRGLLYRARTTLRDAAAAVMPQPALFWASGLLGRMAPTAGRFAELPAPAGSADFGGVLAKGAALAATAAALAVGTGVVPLKRHGAHRAKAAAMGLATGPTTAGAQASASFAGIDPSGALRESRPSISSIAPRAGLHSGVMPRSTGRPARTVPSGRHSDNEADGGEPARARPGIGLRESAGTSSDIGAVLLADGGSVFRRESPAPGSDVSGSRSMQSSGADSAHTGPSGSECSVCGRAPATKRGDGGSSRNTEDQSAPSPAGQTGEGTGAEARREQQSRD
jgi:RNA polymerase sigma factor (sigma-70 family)